MQDGDGKYKIQHFAVGSLQDLAGRSPKPRLHDCNYKTYYREQMIRLPKGETYLLRASAFGRALLLCRSLSLRRLGRPAFTLRLRLDVVRRCSAKHGPWLQTVMVAIGGLKVQASVVHIYDCTWGLWVPDILSIQGLGFSGFTKGYSLGS